MDNKNNNNGILILLIIIVVILSVLCVLFATDIINFKSSNLVIDSNINSSNDNLSDQNIDESNEQDSINNYFYSTNELNVIALEPYKIFEDISNNTNEVESIRIENKYFISLDLSGKVNLKSYSNDNWITGTLNVNNVIDIIKFDVPAPESEQLVYLLTDNGDVYWYRFGDLDSKKFIATKVDSISNVKKLFISNFAKENAGGSWALFAITENNDCIMLKGESV